MRKNTPKPAAPSLSTGKLHPRNRHQGRYDFPQLIQAEPSLTAFVSVNAYGEKGIDFANPQAVLALNRALLKACYGIQHWDIPPYTLCPPIPGRADYVHYLADLLASSNAGIIPKTKVMQVLDIGTGANCIYPLIGVCEYGWHFVATDINPSSLTNAAAILAANPVLAQRVTLRLQTSAAAVFKGIIGDDDWFDATLCNPPFHASAAEAAAGTVRKWENLGLPKGLPKGLQKEAPPDRGKPGLNFGGQDTELWCPGGEAGFILRMIKESAALPTRSFWYTTLVSKSASLPSIYAALKAAKVQEHKTITMSQGQKQSRLVAWTFLNPVQQAAWRKLRW